MNFLDAIIIVPLLYGAYKGFKKGFIFELAMILGLIIGVYLGFKFSYLVYDLLGEFIANKGQLLHILSFFIVVGVILLIFIFYARIMEAMLKITSLNLINKIAGALFGLFKFALVFSVIFWLLKPLQGTVTIIPEKTRQESFLYPYVLSAASMLSPAVKDVKDEFRKNFGDQP